MSARCRRYVPLDPQASALLEQLAASGRPALHELSVADARLAARDSLAAMSLSPEAVAGVSDREIPGPEGKIPVRIYRPSGDAPFRALVYFHGGGWVVCDLDTHDTVCRALANAARCVVVSVDYRLAPEHKYPAAVNDCYAATQWVAAHAPEISADPARIAVGGDSAGGNLATVVCLMARDQGAAMPVFQLLVYPVTDYYTLDTASYREFAEGYFLTRDSMIWFWNHYLSDPRQAPSQVNDPYVCPLRAKDLEGLPPALVITAEYDPLRDEGEQYAARLRAAGVPVVLSRYAGMIHPFFSLGGVLDLGRAAIREAAEALRAAFVAATPGRFRASTPE